MIEKPRYGSLIAVMMLPFAVLGQVSDTLSTKRLDEITITGERQEDLTRLPPLEGTRVWSGKKNEVISVKNLDANIVEKTARQIFAKIPGVFVYDMDGTGNQINISTRGLDLHRGSEFNIRRNDAITNSDMYGYRASHYSMPMEAVDRIQLVRGTGSLQYGAQFVAVNASWRITDDVMLRLNLNNATNKEYFTKRPQFYPGPGVWPSDGRSFVVTLGFKV